MGALSEPYLQHALLAGTAVAVASGLVGYLLVLRAAVFTADALSHVAFTGGIAALALGVDVRLGLLVVTVAGAFGLGLLGRHGRPDDVVTGGVFAWVLGLGVLALSAYSTSGSAAGGGAGVLSGSLLSLTSGSAWRSVAVSAAVVVCVVAVARPLVFASLDEAVAASRGVPVRALGLALLVMLAVTTVEATQAVGALLVLGLLAAPGGAALRLTTRPLRGMVVSAGVAVGSMWTGLAVATALPRTPPSFAILAVAAGAYLVAALATARGPAP